jgi:hypothetical protein
MLARIDKLLHTVRRLFRLDRQLDDIKINQGRILAALNEQRNFALINDYEFKVFSQGGEDGIIQYLVSNLDIKNQTFIEFGTEDFSESNCRFLMTKNNWSGFVMDGSAQNMKRLRSLPFFWRYSLECKSVFITRENINAVLEESGFSKELGILSIDIDGVDYHVLAELGNWEPSIVIVEYNALFGKTRPVSVPYDPAFYRSSKHYSNLYYGASLSAFDGLLSERGYALVGVNSAGNNGFFVRRALLNDKVREVSLNDGFRDSCFREGRDATRGLSFLTGRSRRAVIAEMPLVDTRTGEKLRVGDLID